MQNLNIFINSTLATWFQNHLKICQSSSISIERVNFIRVYMPMYNWTYVQKGYVVNNLVVVCY